MDCKGTSLVKKEKNEIYAEPESLFLEGPLKIVTPSLRIKQDLELKQEDGIEHDCLEDNLVISHPNDFIKEDPELNLEVAASIRNASDSLSLRDSTFATTSLERSLLPHLCTGICPHHGNH
ncbi:uncharacterized protein LOC126108756 isoform X6 [Schistocerca cancellata]|uniref:uncharacterized protein LOC126108652 isoform X2 n=1 Tax=Schistocerca cancellata TaxID=274614 RepID=UPI00211934E2|nr:uncharacterized protein LOC126108652 isoform X2 [Schistocerca cancellata]XP_049770061.1 uncharacterized protein LOC126108756 isoform X5 [Schistocerca cancellata]XP_049770062.1 uncharacterized protein LOC126108756 isoform X6 [Schistocerca cancellata]